MELKSYLKNEFLNDLRKVYFNEPNSVIKDNPKLFRIDEYTIYFGGRDWKNFEIDIRGIDSKNYYNFILCLFTIVVIDLNMFSHFRDQYEKFRYLTLYPKFGWTGFGVHYENPKKILKVPEEKNIIIKDKISAYINEYVDLFIEECDNFFASKMPRITTQLFIQKLMEDNDFKITEQDKDSIFELIYNELKKIVDNKKN